MELITTKQPNMLDVYEVPTYEVLSAALEEYLKKASQGQEEESNVVEPTEAQIAAATAPVTAPAPAPAPTSVNVAQVTAAAPTAEATPAPTPTPASVVSPSAAKAATPATAQDLTKAFDNLFNT
jgi:hypothetical protein